MVDRMSPEARSAHMAKIRSKNTKPELLIRKHLHALGYRYRLHDKKLPGKPDLVFAGRMKVVFVNGCFWHGHDCASGIRLPKTNTEFWADKRRRNQQRDTSQRSELVEAGWTYFDVWECEVGRLDNVLRALRSFLDG